jgi:nitrate reductase gamma subunit
MRKFVQSLAGLIAAATALFCMELQARASWFLDAARYHVAVHSQLSCSECHGRIFADTSHPNCADVSRTLSDFFQVNQCTGCHGEVRKDLEHGFHAGKPIEGRQEYNNCIVCHDPHYQLSTKNLAASFDPSKPVNQQCGACHKLRASLPAMSLQDDKCMACHRSVETESAHGVQKVAVFCFECHSKESKRKNTERASVTSVVPIMDARTYLSTTHPKLSCLACHTRSAEFRHAGKERTPCLNCHQRHDEKIAHDAHLRVSCEACHLAGAIPAKNPESRTILWQIDRKPDKPINVHNMSLKGIVGSCERCHHSGNVLGASAMVLPPKSIMCVPCHAATFSAGDIITIISLLVFLMGLTGLSAVWLSGSVSAAEKSTLEIGTRKTLGNTRRTFFLIRTLNALKIIAFDVFLQRMLFRQSRTRWFIHAMIFFPFMFRFLWGMTALLTSLWIPQSSLPWMLLDRDYALAALLFDVSGVLILIGVILTALRRIVVPPRDMAGIPKQDWLALCLIGGIIVIGFVLEGARIAMEGSSPGSQYAFLGYAVSRVFEHISALPDVYGYIWYLHAIATGAVLAYLPFSHLLHIIVAPVVLGVTAVTVSLEKPTKGLIRREQMQRSTYVLPLSDVKGTK